MSKELSKVLDNYISSKECEILKDEASEEEREMLIGAVKDKIEKIIYEEIKDEVRNQAIADAEKEINKRVGMKRIREYKNLILTGIIVAFFVGLLVNQVTDIIALCKGSVTLENIGITIIIIFVIIVICIFIAIGLFLSEIIKMLESENDEKD